VKSEYQSINQSNVLMWPKQRVCIDIFAKFCGRLNSLE